jgi:hypothetical protein
MGLPKREYYTLQQAARKADCEIEDLLHFAAIGFLQICVHYESDKTVDSDCYFNADISDGLIEELHNTPEGNVMYYLSKYNIITIDSNAYFFTAEDDEPCWADYVKGWFAISHAELTLPSFEIQRKAEVYQLIQPRLNVNKSIGDECGGTKGFEPGGPCFYEPRTFSVEDFVIMDEELNLLMNGGQKINPFGLVDEMEREKGNVKENIGNKTFTSMAKLIKSLLFLVYKDEDILNNPRKHFDNPQSEINKDFDTLGLKLPAGKTIDKWLQGIDLDRS